MIDYLYMLRLKFKWAVRDHDFSRGILDRFIPHMRSCWYCHRTGRLGWRVRPYPGASPQCSDKPACFARAEKVRTG